MSLTSEVAELLKTFSKKIKYLLSWPYTSGETMPPLTVREVKQGWHSGSPWSPHLAPRLRLNTRGGHGFGNCCFRSRRALRRCRDTEGKRRRPN